MIFNINKNVSRIMSERDSNQLKIDKTILKGKLVYQQEISDSGKKMMKKPFLIIFNL
jgi:hypothetical protein